MLKAYGILLKVSIRCVPLLVLTAVSVTSYAQNDFKGVLVNKIDSSVIPFAAIHVVEINKDELTDEHGAFGFSVPSSRKQLTFNISTIGCKTTIIYQRTFSETEKVYVDITPNELNGVAVRGLSAEEVVKKAVRLIPKNYADSSYVSYSICRQYEKVNGVFVNLVEAQPVVMFRLSKTKHEISSKEAFAVQQFRRTKFYPNPFNIIEDNDAVFFMAENPVYHLENSSLLLGKLSNYHFSFDTAVRSNYYYVINYICRAFSSEAHGISNYDPDKFHGESWEQGRLMIERASFAIRKIERTATRYPNFSYWWKPNLLYPQKKYFVEFVNSKFLAEYEPTNGKWYLKRLCHQYTNELFKAVWGTKDYTITDNFEWRSDSVSRYVDASLVNKFYSKMPGRVNNYNKDFWTSIDFPFYFYNKDSVYSDLVRRGPVEAQFYNESKDNVTAR